MNKWLKRLSNWFFQIENEVMIPFVLVGILVIGSFSVISYYNGYTMQKNSEMELADTLFEDVNRDLHFLEKRLPEEEIAEKYRNFERGRIRILDRDGEEITAGTRWENTSVLAVSKGDNPSEMSIMAVGLMPALARLSTISLRVSGFSVVALYLTLAVLREREGLAVPVSDRWKIFSKKTSKKFGG